MITSRVPENWKDLQNEVGLVLRECGMKVEIEKTIETVRGRVEIDVIAEEEIRGRAYKLFCECKNWRNAIPQHVIHSFRTVVQDAGAHKGYIVSAAGFQAGSHAAIDLTNIELVTWVEFQQSFERTWLEAYFTPVLTAELDPLMSYVEPLAPLWFRELPEEDQKAFAELRAKYEFFGWFIMSMSTYGNMFRQRTWPTLPISGSAHTKEFEHIPADILDARGYRELMEASLEFGRYGIAEFRAIRDRNGKCGGE